MHFLRKSIVEEIHVCNPRAVHMIFMCTYTSHKRILMLNATVNRKETCSGPYVSSYRYDMSEETSETSKADHFINASTGGNCHRRNNSKYFCRRHALLEMSPEFVGIGYRNAGIFSDGSTDG